jgi:ArsR family transcriptional regulator, arsenate/arsenite/antimonite-responsive transcriptional repressor
MREITKLFKALSDPNRVRIIKMLEIRPLCVCEIPALLNIGISTVSKHLSILRDAGFINDEKKGKWVYYSLNKKSNKSEIKQLLTLFQSWLIDNIEVKSYPEKIKEIELKICSIEIGL